MRYEFYILMVLAYLVMIAISAFAGYADGERGNDGSEDIPTWCVFSTLMGMGIAMAIMILDTNFAERTFALKIAFWAAGMLVAACMSTWARKAGYAEYRAKHPFLA